MLRGGLYTSNATTGLPDTLIEEGTPQATDAVATIVVPLAAARTIDAPVWLAVCTNGYGSWRQGKVSDKSSRIFGLDTVSGTANVTRLRAAYAYAALPADTSGLSFATNSGTIFFGARIA